MKAQKQLEAFPRSDNERARQLHYGAGAVVSFRLTGSVIAQLDAMAERLTKERGLHAWNKVTRTQLVKHAITAMLAEKPAKKGKRK